MRIFTLGPHGSFGFLSWTTNRRRAKGAWDKFWTEDTDSPTDRESMRGVDYFRIYVELRGESCIGAEDSLRTQKRIEDGLNPRTVFGEPEAIDISNLRLPGGTLEAMGGINTSRFVGFEDDGVGYKDIEKECLDMYCPPLPTLRNF